MAWGTGAWGTGPWGGWSGTTAVTAAHAVSTRTVRVTVAGKPQVDTEWTPGDALNPALWTVALADGTYTWTVTEVLHVQEDSGSSPAIFDLYLLESLRSSNKDHTVTPNGVVDAAGLAITGSATFAGVIEEAISTPDKQAADKTLILRDLANPPVITEDYVGGTLVMEGSDYKNEQGSALVRKLILRRLTTVRGSYFHLPDYGLAVAPKSTPTLTDLIDLNAEAERQALEEPEVESAEASVTMDPAGILTIALRCKLRPNGEPLEISTPLPAVNL